MSGHHHGSLSTETQRQIILIAEDDLALGEMIMFALEQETSYQPYLVMSGRAALQVVRELTPTLFLLDYQLPSMTGLQLYDQLHKRKGLETVPAIMMSANLPIAELEKRHILGLTKPFELDELLDIIAQALTEGTYQE